jgi:hypothetical protein
MDPDNLAAIAEAINRLSRAHEAQNAITERQISVNERIAAHYERNAASQERAEIDARNGIAWQRTYVVERDERAERAAEAGRSTQDEILFVMGQLKVRLESVLGKPEGERP